MVGARQGPLSPPVGALPAESVWLLGTLGQILDPANLPVSLSRATELLREAVDADDAELFLADPSTGTLVLTAAEGPDRDAFFERMTFLPGEGHPGRSLARGKPLQAKDITHDRRYLRSEVKRRGLRSYLSIPLMDVGGPLGSLHFAWRDVGAPMDEAVRRTAPAARPIATTIRAALATLGSAARGAEPGDPVEVVHLLRRLWADDVASAWIRLPGRAVSSGGRRQLATVNLERCPSLLEGRPVMLDPSGAPASATCLECGSPTRARCCLPIPAAGGASGLIGVEYDVGLPGPPTRDLVALELFARELGAREEAVTEVAPAAAAALELRCLGSFEVAIGGVRVPNAAFARRGAVTLLKILALREGRPITREALADMLWPDADLASATNRLHGWVHALRAAVEPCTSDRERWRYVISEGDQYRLDTSAIDVDLTRFRAALSAWRRESAEPAASIRHLEAAASLLHGDLFEDDPFADWCASERTELRRQRVEVLAALGRVHATHGDPERAAEVFRESIRVDPLREELHRELIGLLVKLRRPHEARAQYDAVVRLLEDELGAAPSLELRRLMTTLGVVPPRRSS